MPYCLLKILPFLLKVKTLSRDILVDTISFFDYVLQLFFLSEYSFTNLLKLVQDCLFVNLH